MSENSSDKIYKCKYCSKICKNRNSYAQHIIRCKFNVNRINVYNEGFNKKGARVAWNKGLTKNSDKRILKSIETFYKNKKAGLHINYSGKQVWSEESRQRLRESAIHRGLGGVRPTKKVLYRGVKLGSTYEVELAKDLDSNNVNWNIPKRIKYFDLNNKLHYYSPDLYLPDYNIYLDPKNDFLINNINPRLGYKDSDKIKWVCEQNNIKVFILNKDQLTWKYIKDNLLV